MYTMYNIIVGLLVALGILLLLNKSACHQCKNGGCVRFGPAVGRPGAMRSRLAFS